MTTFHLSSLDLHFADFVSRIESRACEELWIAAALVSAVSSCGHVCLDLSRAAEYSVEPANEGGRPIRIPPAGHWQELLAGCTTVGRPGEYTPLVLDASGRLYLHRSWDSERRVAEGLLARSALLPLNAVILEAALDRYFPPRGGEADLQREAACTALTYGCTVISGGPGTGKTTTVARILALLVEMADGNPLPRILLAAPTGKAAMRLNRSLLHTLGQSVFSGPVRSALPQEVFTLHRLLGVIPGRSGFRHDCENPLHCDVLVIDEASMVDLPLMARLLDALRADTRLILLGDRDQLASVEAGAVLSDICAGGYEDTAGRRGRPAVVHLTKSYRFDDESGIGRLGRLVNAGDSDAALALLKSGHCSDVSWRPLPSAENFAGSFAAAACDGYSAFARATTPVEALEALELFRVLAPHREGRYGVGSLNNLIDSALNRLQSAEASASASRAVMVTGNTYDLGLFNGDTGVLMGVVGDSVPAAYFPDPVSGVRRVSELRLPQHETAFAQTVHKAQGSEYENVLLIMPDKISEVLSRELLYTAITRARKRVEIWSGEEVFCRAVERRLERNSGLRDRLWGEVRT